MYFDVDDRLRWALRLKAAGGNFASVAELVRVLIEDACRDELSEVDRRIAKGETPKASASRRGRKPKPRARP